MEKLTKDKIPPSNATCSLLVRFVSEDDHIYHFDESWNITIGEFQLLNLNATRLKVTFTFQAQLISRDENGHTTTLIADEGLREIQPYLENVEILLDLLSLQVGTPLAIEDGSFQFSGAGYGSSTSPVTNVNKLFDIQGLGKRYVNLIQNKDLINATRFFRLSQSDKENNGKAIKLWATLEALHKGYEKGIKTIWDGLEKSDKKMLEDVINKLSIKSKEKEHLLNALRSRKSLSKQEMLSRQIKLMNSKGEYTTDEINELIKWWSQSRHSPAHGERIEKTDENILDAISDLKNTLETLLRSDLEPSLYGYFIGHPEDLDNHFWDKDDYTIKKLSKDCWIKPSHFMPGASDSILNDIAHKKIKNNAPFLFVSHDRIMNLSKNNTEEITDLKQFPEVFQKAIKKVQAKLNRVIN